MVVMVRSIVGILAICIVVVAMDIAAALFAIKAQAAQDEVRELRLLIFECKEASPKVFKLGVAAAGFLGVSHLLVNLFGCCTLFCCCTTSPSTDIHHHQQHYSTHKAASSSFTRQCSFAFLFATWVVLGIGMFVLVASVRDNMNKSNHSPASCGLSHHHFLSYGAISCFAHAVSSVAFYVTAAAPAAATD